MIRRPAAAGSFYYLDRGMLMKQVEGCLNPKAVKQEVCGVVVPHAGIQYSGKVAGMVYSAIEMPDTFVILGPNHTDIGQDFSLDNQGAWMTPLGEVKINPDLAESIFKHSKVVEVDKTAHQHEHSIEVQLPFMQYYSDHFQIVPIAVRHYTPTEQFLEACTDAGNAIAAAIKKTREKVVVVASTDFTHYESRQRAVENDKKALDAILDLDARRLFKEVQENNITMCGYGPAAVTIAACKKLGCRKTELLGYMTSGDVSGDYSQVVGYGGVAIKK